MIVKADAVVADTQPELGRLDVLETLHVAFSGAQIAGQCMENAEGSRLVDGAELSFSPTLGGFINGVGDFIISVSPCATPQLRANFPGLCGGEQMD